MIQYSCRLYLQEYFFGAMLMYASREKLAKKVSLIGFFGNVILFILKLTVGLAANSQAMLSEAVNSGGDVLNAVIIFAGITLSTRKPDLEHPYGHERFECIASLILSGVMFFSAVMLGARLISSLMNGISGEEIPGAAALAVAAVTISAKAGLWLYTRRAAKRLNSVALAAEAADHRSDILASVGTFIGILGARLGFKPADAVAGLIVSILIVKTAVSIFKEAAGQMVDRACDDEMTERLRELIASEEGVIRIDELRTRVFGSVIYVDVEIAADGEASLNETHGIAERVHDKIEAAEPRVRHCMVHVNPA